MPIILMVLWRFVHLHHHPLVRRGAQAAVSSCSCCCCCQYRTHKTHFHSCRQSLCVLMGRQLLGWLTPPTRLVAVDSVRHTCLHCGHDPINTPRCRTPAPPGRSSSHRPITSRFPRRKEHGVGGDLAGGGRGQIPIHGPKSATAAR